MAEEKKRPTSDLQGAAEQSETPKPSKPPKKTKKKGKGEVGGGTSFLKYAPMDKIKDFET